MAYLININSIKEEKGEISIVEKELPFEIKRFYYMYNMNKKFKRAQCSHKNSIQAIICMNGSCDIYVENKMEQDTYSLNTNNKILVIEKNDWHEITILEDNSILLVFSSNYYDKNDYEQKRYLNEK